MLKSQSINNLSDQRKSKTSGFLNSLKSRKSSSKDLKSHLRPNNNVANTESTSKHSHRHSTISSRPITSSMSSTNLLSRFHDSSDHLSKSPSKSKNDYSSTVARERGGRIIDKENFTPPQTLKSKKSSSSIGSFHDEYLPHIPPFKTLRTRSSAPNLKSNSSTSSASTPTNPHNFSNAPSSPSISPPILSENESCHLKRDSTYLSLSALASASINLPGSPSLVNILSDDETIADSNSPYTPPSSSVTNDKHGNNNTDSLFDESSIIMQPFDYTCISDDDFEDTVVEEDDEFDDESSSQEEQSREQHYLPKVKKHNYRKLHRTANILNISEFIKSIDHNNTEIIPINNRCSLEFEQKECYKMKLNLLEATPEKPTNSVITPTIDLHLVENVMFLTILHKQQQEEKEQEYTKRVMHINKAAESFDTWHDQDYFDILKNESYESEDDELYLDL